ncbi:MAG: hypothetical protein ACLFSE_14660 [Spirochaetia bacterium]
MSDDNNTYYEDQGEPREERNSQQPNRKPKKKCKDMEEWWEERSLPEKIIVGTGFGILGIGLLFLFGWAVMLLWNWLMPYIFGLPKLNYWKAWGVLILSSILFKGMHGGSESSSRRQDKKRKRELRRVMREDDTAESDRPADIS